jgi:hypothetical protein
VIATRKEHGRASEIEKLERESVMTSRRTTAAATALALTLMLGPGTTALGQKAHGQQGQQHMQQAPAQQGMPMHRGMMGQGMGPGMMGQGGMWHVGPHMMSPDEMQEMMEHMGGMTGEMGPGLMGQGMSPARGGWSGLEGSRVVPMMQLSTDDVRGFFERYLESLGNARLKIGKVAAMDDDTITADIVTVDDSLVERFAVDRHTGLISAAG